MILGNAKVFQATPYRYDLGTAQVLPLVSLSDELGGQPAYKKLQFTNNQLTINDLQSKICSAPYNNYRYLAF